MADAIDPRRGALELLLEVVGESRAREIVADVGTRTAQLELDRIAAVRLAVRMLSERASRPTIRDRLVARGVHVRKAYRVISTALSIGPFGCDTEGPSLSLPLDTLEPSNQSEPPAMTQQSTAKNDHLNVAADEIRARLAAIDLPAARQRLEQAVAARDAMSSSRGSSWPVQPPGADEPTKDVLDSIAQRDRVYEEAKSAAGRLRSLEADESRLRNDLAEIEALIDGEADLERAREAEGAAEDAYKARMSTRFDCEHALKRIDALIGAEKEAIETSRRSAGASVLAAIKGGAVDVKIDTLSSDRLAALNEARGTAQREHQVAQAAEQAARSGLAAARRQVLVVHSTTLEAAFRPIEQAYLEKLTALFVAKSTAGLAYFPAVDPRAEAHHRAGRVLGVN